MADITEAIEQDAIAQTLVDPLPQPDYAAQDDSPEYRHADGEEGVDFRADLPAEDAPELIQDAADDSLSATPDEKREYFEASRQWDSLTPEQQGAQADQYLRQAYTDAYQSISPREAQEFTKNFGEAVGQPDLARVVNPTQFATFAHAWDQNLENTVRLHPSGPDFLEALSDTRNPNRAIAAAVKLCDRQMAQRFLEDFATITGRADVVQGVDPVQFAAHWAVQAAYLNGWGQSQSTGHTRSKFKTNTDLFDDEMEQAWTQRNGAL